MTLATDPDFFRLLVDSYIHAVGASPPFFEPGQPRTADWLYHSAPACVVAHNTDADPRFIYANCAAQDCFEYDWGVFTELPSRLSAGPSDRAERQRLLDRVAEHGFITDYRGLRIARSGRRFMIEDGVIWNLVDRDRTLRGQAATFSAWRDV